MADKRIDAVLAEVNTKLDYPPEVIQDVVKYIFQFMRSFLTTPTAAGLRLTYLGVFRVSRIGLYRHYKRLLQQERFEQFRKIWPTRILVLADLKRRFKTKYGTAKED